MLAMAPVHFSTCHMVMTDHYSYINWWRAVWVDIIHGDVWGLKAGLLYINLLQSSLTITGQFPRNDSPRTLSLRSLPGRSWYAVSCISSMYNLCSPDAFAVIQYCATLDHVTMALCLLSSFQAYHIKGWTKWLLICRYHFQKHFCKWNLFYLK